MLTLTYLYLQKVCSRLLSIFDRHIKKICWRKLMFIYLCLFGLAAGHEGSCQARDGTHVPPAVEAQNFNHLDHQESPRTDVFLNVEGNWYLLTQPKSLSLLFSYVQLFCNAVDYSLPGSSVHGISQARILDWVAIFFSRGTSWTCLLHWQAYFLPLSHQGRLTIKPFFVCSQWKTEWLWNMEKNLAYVG